MNATTSWEIQDDDSTDTAWACSKTVAREVGSNSDLLQTLRFRINTADDVLAAKVVLTTPAGTLEFRYTLRARQRALRHRPWLPTERVTLWRLRVESKVSAARSRQCGATRFAFLDDGPVRCR
jgi:hypothetical protein